MKEVWVLSVKTSLPDVCWNSMNLKTTFYAFDSFEKGREAMRKVLHDLAFSKNSMFDGNGNIIYLKKYIEDMCDEEYIDDGEVLDKNRLRYVSDSFCETFKGKDVYFEMNYGVEKDDVALYDYTGKFVFNDGDDSDFESFFNKVDEYLELFVNIQIEIHSKTSPRLNKLWDKMHHKIDETTLDATTKYELHTRLKSMQKHHKVCHGDFNPSNVIIATDGTPFVIDWSHATQGNGAADAARTYLTFCLKDQKDIAEKYLKLFCEKTDTARQYVNAWMPIVAASQSVKGKPGAIVMKTVKGKDISFMENNAGWHGKAPNDAEYAQAMGELKAKLAELEG